jgi:hypothetical protein
VPTVSVLGGDRDLRPGQPDQLGMQLRLVRLRDQQVVPAAVVQVLGVCALGVQRVRGEQHIGQVETVQQRGERGDFVGLALDLGLAQHCPGCGVERGQQMHLGVLIGAGAAGGLPVDRDHPHPTRPRWRNPAGQPGRQRRIE